MGTCSSCSRASRDARALSTANPLSSPTYHCPWAVTKRAPSVYSVFDSGHVDGLIELFVGTMSGLLTLAIFLGLFVVCAVANPNCQNSTECPVWPTQFSSPFTLYGNIPKIENASSMFYYKYLSGENQTQAQLVDYLDRCLPFVNVKSALKAIPCKLLFINSGIYLHQPKHDIECCQFVKDVGAVPPAFLKAYTYKGTNISAPDMYGNK